ncbi:MAG: response regulator, partial [Myxococcales bacterium]|nr:response regulator [Myxococcales bacterium]
QILLVEDSPDNRTIATEYLKDTPYRIDFAENGAVACERFMAGQYDLVLMDRQMPVMDGLTATRTIRKWEEDHQRAPTPIVALTASALKGDQELFVAAGCTAYLTKPIKQAVLLEAIRTYSVVAHASSLSTEILMEPMAGIAALVPGYLDNRRADVTTLQEAVERNDFGAVGRLGHSMRGAGSSYGFPLITEIGAALEEAAAAGDGVASRKWIAELADYLGRVRLIVR